MPSPFPGMDPYLESPEFFPGLHDNLVIELERALQACLPPAYFADTRSRVWVEYMERAFEPDVDIVRSSDAPAGIGSDNGGGTAVAVRVQPVVVYVPNETREIFLEIRTVQGERRLVTALEVLSPSNKIPGAHGRDKYEEKQLEVLSSKVNLIEIDLLRGGTHTTAVPRARAEAEAGPFDYHVCVRRFANLGRYFVYPIRLEQRLPEIAIPLLPGDPDVAIDLQAVLDRCYDFGPYRRISPYRDANPVPPLRPEQQEWASRLLRDKGLLPDAGRTA